MSLSKKRKAEYNKRYYQKSKLGILKPIKIPKPDAQQAKLGELRQLIKSIEHKSVQPKEEKLSIYNPAIHRAGDKVLIQQGKRLIPTIVPSIDADGHPY